MTDYCFKLGEGIAAEVLTAAVVRGGRPVLFLSRVLPGRWAIQRPGAAEGDATPSWGGEADGWVAPRVPFFDEDRLPAEVAKALESLEGEADGASPAS